jgi:hypothetical protein
MQDMDSKQQALPAAPESFKEAKKQLAAARRRAEDAATAEPEPGLEPRYGSRKSPITAAIDRALQCGEIIPKSVLELRSRLVGQKPNDMVASRVALPAAS